MRTVLALLVAILVLPTATLAQEEDATVTQVRDNLYMLTSPQGGNVVVSTGEDGTFLVDAQLAGRSEVIAANIKAITPHPVKFILNTHYHFDQTGGNEAFGGQGAVIVAHDNVRKRLSTKQFISYFGREMEPLSGPGLPSVTFDDDITLRYNGDVVRVYHMPNAHTDGDAFAHFTGNNVIVAGDIIFHGIYPFIDTEHGGSIKGMIAAVGKIIKLSNPDTLIVPGHGKLMRYGDVVAYRSMLATITGRIEGDIKAGKTLEDILASKPTQEFDEYMGEGFVRPDAFIELLYNDLSGKASDEPASEQPEGQGEL